MDAYAPCPKCRAAASERVKFTWWGGVLGPKILNHVKCRSCGHKFNGKTGADNTAKIAIYMAVVGVICFGLMFVAAAAFVLMSLSK
jgi:hypothetical protein